MTPKQAATKYFHPIMIISTILFLNRRNYSPNTNINNNIIYLLQNLSVILIVCLNAYSTYTNLFLREITIYFNNEVNVFVCIMLVLSFLGIVLVSYLNSRRNYTAVNDIIQLLNMADEYVENLRSHLEKLNISLNINKSIQYSPWDFPVMSVGFMFSYLSARVGDYLWYGDDSLDMAISGVFSCGFLLVMQTNIIIMMFQRVLYKKYKLINLVLIKLITSDKMSDDSKEIVETVKNIWNMCDKVYKKLIDAFGVNMIMMFINSYMGCISNLYYVLGGEWSAFIYGVKLWLEIASSIYLQEVLINEVNYLFCVKMC